MLLVVVESFVAVKGNHDLVALACLLGLYDLYVLEGGGRLVSKMGAANRWSRLDKHTGGVWV